MLHLKNTQFNDLLTSGQQNNKSLFTPQEIKIHHPLEHLIPQEEITLVFIPPPSVPTTLSSSKH